MTVWDELLGQNEAVAQLRRAVVDEAPAHAWLITGPPGSGRTVAARAFAAALNCERPDPAERGCGECHACRTTLSGSHPDLTFVETDKTTITIDQARELIVAAQDRPASGRWRVMVIADSDRMLERTTNVLLKAIEEPPPRTIWILCAPSPADVLVTIRSRCRMLNLKVPSAESVAALLVRRDGVDPALAMACARAAQSHVGIARRLASDEQARNRRAEIVRIPLSLEAIPQAVRSAATLVEAAQADAESANAERNEAEKQQLLQTLGVAGDSSIPNRLRGQVKRLEEDQKRRARRSVTDSLDRALTDLLSTYTDALKLRLSSDDVPDSALINAGIRAEVWQHFQHASAESLLRRVESINATRRAILTSNIAPLLAVESMMATLV